MAIGTETVQAALKDLIDPNTKKDYPGDTRRVLTSGVERETTLTNS